MIVENVKKLCLDKGITMYRLEKEIGITANLIPKWNRCSPSVDKLKKVADYFGVTLDYLVTEHKGE